MARRRSSKAKPGTTDKAGTGTEGAAGIATPETASLSAAADETPRPPVPEGFVVEAEGLAPDEIARILEKRARVLAQVPPAREGGEVIQAVTFALGDELYAIEISCVSGIYPLEGLTPVPCTPDYCAGVVNLRGRILSVIDIHRFMGLPGAVAHNGAQVIVVRAAGVEVGILADRVLEVHSLPLAELQPALPTTSRGAAEYARGVAPDMRVLLDLPALLGDGRIVVREKIEA